MERTFSKQDCLASIGRAQLSEQLVDDELFILSAEAQDLPEAVPIARQMFARTYGTVRTSQRHERRDAGIPRATTPTKKTEAAFIHGRRQQISQARLFELVSVLVRTRIRARFIPLVLHTSSGAAL